jgi:hypothetical protein
MEERETGEEEGETPEVVRLGVGNGRVQEGDGERAGEAEGCA